MTDVNTAVALFPGEISRKEQQRKLRLKRKKIFCLFNTKKDAFN